MRKKNSEFDDLIRNKLEGMQPAYDPASWQELQHKLDRIETAGQPAATDEQFDSLVAEKLQRVYPPYQRASWLKLVAQLDRQERIIRFVQRAKTIEVAVACLLLLFLGQAPMTLPGDAPFEAPLEQAQAQLQPQTSTNAPTGNMLTPALTEANDSRSTAAGQNNSLAQGEQPEYVADQQLSASSDTPFINDYTAVKADQVHALPLSAPVVPASQTPSPPLRVEMYKPMPINAYDFVPAEPIAAIGAGGINRLNYPEIHPEDLPKPQPLVKKRFVRVGMLGSSDVNRIITPPVTVSPQAENVGFDRYALGYGGGITLGFETHRWEVETGLIYAAKRYTPLQILYVEGSVKSGFFGASLEQFELNTVNVPLHFRYNYFVRDKWRLYAFAGASWHVVTQANYYVNFRPNAQLLQAPAPLDSDPARNTGLEEKNLANGWLEGGSFMQNSYLSVNGGAGIERYMSTRWSIFAQPTYQHSILYFGNGLGPYHDRMHTMSIVTGLKVRL